MIVKELIGFLTGKFQIVQNKIKILIEGIDSYIPPISDVDNKLKD